MAYFDCFDAQKSCDTFTENLIWHSSLPIHQYIERQFCEAVKSRT